MNLTPHFTLEELTRSSTAAQLGIDNTPPAEALENLKRLAPFLETVREALGNHPMQINSGYRCHALNEAVGGVHNSAHLYGLAVDFVCPEAGGTLSICAKLRGTPGLEYDQLIHEENGQGYRWVHIAIAEAGKTPRGEVWTIERGVARAGL